ncbi:MAG TPA: hypothetical protein VNJ70_14875 [Thermoanaerobaculia bacterium]|nr:hypothetical protein [Thermoanaerobaculia bacterium]
MDHERIRHVRDLFDVWHDGRTVLQSNLELVGSELGRLASIETADADRQSRLKSAVFYTSFRLSEALSRLSFIHWLRQQFQSTDPHDLWRIFAGLAVKDFHVDVASLMDSVAPVIILTDNRIKSKDQIGLPGFADIQAGSPRTYRTQLNQDLVTLVDSAEAWWPFVKRVRDLLTHRRHSRIVFCSAADGFLVQVYDPADQPIITNSALAARLGTNVADFLLYSSWVMAEIVFFFDQLGRLLANRFQIPADVMQSGGRVGEWRPFLSSLNDLLERLQQPAP